MQLPTIKNPGAELAHPATITDLVNTWGTYIDVSKATAQTYAKGLKAFLLFLKEKEIVNPRRDDVISFRNETAATHKATTANGYLIAVKQFFKWTELSEFYPDITKQVKSIPISREHKKDALTANQAAELLGSMNAQTVQEKRDYAVCALMLTTGLRTIEVSRANIEDLRPLGDDVVLYIQGKRRSEKAEYVKIPHQVETAIRSYLASRGAASEKEPLFKSESNRNQSGAMTTRAISGICKKALRESGLNSSRLTAHSFRHTAATQNLLNGGSLEDTKQLLRHTNINTTMIYSHALERAKNNSESRIAAAIFGN